MQGEGLGNSDVAEWMEQVSRLGALLGEHQYLILVTAALVFLVVAAAGRSGRRDPDGPQVPRRKVRALSMVLWLRAADRIARRGSRQSARRGSRWGRGPRPHEWPALKKRYEGEFGAVIGGPGIGKTMRVLVPMIAWIVLSRLRSVVVLDPKGEIFAALIGLCGRPGGRPLVYLYSTLRTHADDIVCSIDVFADSPARANFLEAILPDPPGGDPTWSRRARRALRVVSDGLRRAGRRSDLVATYDVIKDPTAMDELARTDAEVAGVWAGQGNRTHESARTEALSPLEGLEDARIRRVFDGSRMHPERAEGPPFKRRTAAFLCVGPDDAGRAGPLYSGLVDYLQRRAAYRKEGPKVDFVVEEAGSYFTLEKLDEYVNMGRGFGVNVLIVLQNFDQLKKRLGDHAASSIVGAMDVLMFGRTRNVATGRLLEELSGTVRVRRDAPVARPSLLDHLTGSARVPERRVLEEERPRFRAQDLYTLDDGNLIVLGHRKLLEWVDARRALWFRYSRRVLPGHFDFSELRLVRPEPPAAHDADEAGEGRLSEPACPTCSHPNPPGVVACAGCGGAL